MDTNDWASQSPQFRVLSDQQIERVFHATLECLQRTGVNVHNPEARSLLAGAGADVDGVRVRMPPHIIQEAIAVSPPTFSLWGRPRGGPETQGEQQRVHVSADRVCFGPGPTCTFFVDPETGRRRKTRRGDPALTARVCDALDNIDYVMSLGLIDDVTPALAPVYEFAEMIANTGKPVLPWAYSVENVKDIFEIGVAVAGSEEALRQRPFFALFSTFQSPLIHTDHDLANALWAAANGVPVVYLGGGTAGSTAPVTGAGTLVTSLAGALSGLAIIQLKTRGAAVCMGVVPHAMDLRTLRPAYGGPELSLYSAAVSDICRYLDLPFMGTAGASDAKVLDLQAAIESTMQVLFAGLSGATMVHDVGFLDCADIGSLEMLVMNDEIIAILKWIISGIQITDETLMLGLIDRVGPGSEFTSAKETAKRCRSEIWMPTLMDRQPWTSWEALGGTLMSERVQVKLQNILENHWPPPLSASAMERIEAILQAAEAREQNKRR